MLVEFTGNLSDDGTEFVGTWEASWTDPETLQPMSLDGTFRYGLVEDFFPGTGTFLTTDPAELGASAESPVQVGITSPESGWDRESGEAPPALPDAVVERTRERYLEAYDRLAKN